MYDLYMPNGFTVENIDMIKREVSFSTSESRNFTKRFNKLIYMINNKYLTDINYLIEDLNFIYKKADTHFYFKNLLDYLNFINKGDFTLKTSLFFNVIKRTVYCNYKFKMTNEINSRYITVEELKIYNDYCEYCKLNNVDLNIYDYLNFSFYKLNRMIKKSDNTHSECIDINGLNLLSNLKCDFISHGYKEFSEFETDFDDDYIFDCIKTTNDDSSFVYTEDNETYLLLFGNKEIEADEYEVLEFKNDIEKCDFISFDYTNFYNYKTSSLANYFISNSKELGDPYYLKQYYDNSIKKLILVFYNKNKEEIFRSDSLGSGLIYFIIRSCLD